jgi:hypothetical protein
MSKKFKLDKVVHACIPSTQEAEAGGLQFEDSLGYIVRFCLKKTVPPQKINQKKREI